MAGTLGQERPRPGLNLLSGRGCGFRADVVATRLCCLGGIRSLGWAPGWKKATWELRVRAGKAGRPTSSWVQRVLTTGKQNQEGNWADLDEKGHFRSFFRLLSYIYFQLQLTCNVLLGLGVQGREG